MVTRRAVDLAACGRGDGTYDRCDVPPGTGVASLARRPGLELATTGPPRHRTRRRSHPTLGSAPSPASRCCPRSEQRGHPVARRWCCIIRSTTNGCRWLVRWPTNRMVAMHTSSLLCVLAPTTTMTVDHCCMTIRYSPPMSTSSLGGFFIVSAILCTVLPFRLSSASTR